MSCSGVTLGGAAGFGTLVVVVSSTLRAAEGEACGLTRVASRMVESFRIATSWASPTWFNGAAGTRCVSALARAFTMSAATLAEEIFETVH